MALDYKSSLSRYRRYLQVVREQPLIRAGVWTALSLILVIVMITMALKPTLVVIANLLGQIRQDKEIITKLDDKIVKMQKATSEMDAIASRLTVLDQALPQIPNWDKWAGEVAGIASESGAQVVAISVGPAPITGKWNAASESILPKGTGAMTFSVTAGGKYDQLRQIVTAIEGTRRLNVLTSVQFSSVKNKTGGTDLSVYIKGVAAYTTALTQ